MDMSRSVIHCECLRNGLRTMLSSLQRIYVSVDVSKKRKVSSQSIDAHVSHSELSYSDNKVSIASGGHTLYPNIAYCIAEVNRAEIFFSFLHSSEFHSERNEYIFIYLFPDKLVSERHYRYEADKRKSINHSSAA